MLLQHQKSGKQEVYRCRKQKNIHDTQPILRKLDVYIKFHIPPMYSSQVHADKNIWRGFLKIKNLKLRIFP